MSDFKDRLWRDLLRDHRAELEPLAAPSVRHSRRRRPRMLAGTTVGLAGAGTIVALVLGAASSSPAFAVNRNSDGTISVMIIRPAGIRGANARLATLGIHARAVEVMAGCHAAAPPALIAARLLARADQIHATSWVRKGVVTRIYPGRIPAGKTLVLATSRARGEVRLVTAHAVSGQAPPCLPPPGKMLWRGPGRGVQCIATGSVVPVPGSPEGGTVTSGTETSTTGTETSTTGTETSTTGTDTSTTGTTTSGTGTTTTAIPAPPRPPHFRGVQCRVQRFRPGTSTTGTGTTTTGTDTGPTTTTGH